jgi:hypothetical protein
MKKALERFSLIIVPVLLASLTFIGCPIFFDDDCSTVCYPTLSGSVFVSLNAEVKAFSKVTVFSDSELTKVLGSVYVYNSEGNAGIGDYYSFLPLQNRSRGQWDIQIKEKINTPIRKVWIKVQSNTFGSGYKIIEYPLYLYDQNISGIDLGLIQLPGTGINLKVGNNFTYNGAPVSDNKCVRIRRYGKDEPCQYSKYEPFNMDPQENNLLIGNFYTQAGVDMYSWNTGIIKDDDKILITIFGWFPEYGIERIEITGSTLKSGYTLDNITLKDNL